MTGREYPFDARQTIDQMIAELNRLGEIEAEFIRVTMGDPPDHHCGPDSPGGCDGVCSAWGWYGIRYGERIALMDRAKAMLKATGGPA